METTKPSPATAATVTMTMEWTIEFCIQRTMKMHYLSSITENSDL